MTARSRVTSILCALLLSVATAAGAQEAGTELVPSGAGLGNQASLQRGAKLFFNYCVGCHSLKYMRYSRLGEDLGLSEKEVMENLNFTGAKWGETVVSHMPEAGATAWFGKAPPDLSLEARSKSPDWIYNYLNSFYLDPSRPVGWNNVVFPNASMPFPLWELQGLQTAEHAPGQDGPVKLSLSAPGTMTPEQFHQATRDITSFLQYVAEPAAMQRQRMGLWVLLFIALFTGLAYLLKKEYWKDVH